MGPLPPNAINFNPYQIVIKFLCRIKCPSGCHTNILPYQCDKKCKGMCNQCGPNHEQLKYVYKSIAYIQCFRHYFCMCAKIVHCCDNNAITIYNVHAINNFILNGPFAWGTDSISLFNRVFVIGDNSCSSKVFELDMTTRSLLQKENMLKGKRTQTLCAGFSNIYSIGGYIRDATSNCQKYSIYKNKWMKLPDLSVARCHCAAFCFCFSEVYALGGWDGDNNLNTMEKINIRKPIKWNSVIIENPFSKRTGIQAIQISVSEVIVFGGVAKKFYNESYILHFEECGVYCKKSRNLQLKGEFQECPAPIFDGENVYANNTEALQIYSIKDKKWKIRKNDNK